MPLIQDFKAQQRRFKDAQLCLKSIAAAQTLPLRQAVLWPNHPLSQSCLDDDARGLHLGLHHGQQLIAVASLFQNRRQLRLRKFALAHTYQHQGLGSWMLQQMISFAQNHRDIDSLCCDARVDALGFYQAQGLSCCSEVFYKQQIAYRKMQITL